MPRTPKVVEDRREQIIDAAIRVFAQKGFVRATNRDVAHEAGITTGLIYYYFKSKEDLLKAVLDERSPAQVITQVTPDMLEQPPEVLLPRMLQRVLSIVESEQFISLIRVMLPEMLQNTTQVETLALAPFQRVLFFLGNYLKVQLAKGTVRADLDVDRTTQVIVSSLMGMVLRRQVIRDPSVVNYTQEEVVQAVLDTILQGIQPH